MVARNKSPSAEAQGYVRVQNMHISDVHTSVARMFKKQNTASNAGLTIQPGSLRFTSKGSKSKFAQQINDVNTQHEFEVNNGYDGTAESLAGDLTKTSRKNVRKRDRSFSDSEASRILDPRKIEQCFKLGTDGGESIRDDLDIVDFLGQLGYREKMLESLARFRSGQFQASALCTLLIAYLCISKIFDFSYQSALNILYTCLCTAYVLYGLVMNSLKTPKRRHTLRRKPGVIQAMMNPLINKDPRISACHDVRHEYKVRKRYDMMAKRARSIHSYTPSEMGDDSATIAHFASDLSETRPYVHGTLNGVYKTRFLIDSGSSVSTINEVALKELEAIWGRELPRLESSLILKSYGGKDLSVLGVVFADIGIGNSNFYTPLVVVDSTSFSPCILGTNLIVRKKLVMDWDGEHMYIRFASKKVPLAKVHLLDSTNQPLYAIETTDSIMPGQVKVVSVALVSTYCPRVPHTLNGKRGLVTKSPDCDLPIEIEGVGTFKNHVLQVPVKNVGETEISLPRFSTLGGFDLLEPNDLIDLSRPTKFAEEGGAVLLSTCPCRETNKVILCSPQGNSFLGEHLNPRPLNFDSALEGTMISGKRTIYIIPHSKTGYTNFTKEDFCKAAEKAEFRETFPISVIYARPELLNIPAHEYLANLMLDYQLQLRYSAAFSRVNSCTKCRLARLQFNPGLAVKSEDVLDIYLFLARNEMKPGKQWFQLHRDSPVTKLSIGGLIMQSYRRTLQQVTLFSHLAPSLGENEYSNALLQLFIQLRDLYPNAELHVAQSSITAPEGIHASQPLTPKTAGKVSCLAAPIRTALARLRHLRGRTTFNLRRQRRKPAIDAEMVDVSRCTDLPVCTQVCCSSPVLINTHESVYEGDWPKPDYTQPELDDYVNTKVTELGIPIEDFQPPTGAEIGSLILHDFNLRFTGPPEVAVHAVDFSGNYTRAVEQTFTPATIECSLDEAANPFGYERGSIPKVSKHIPDSYLEGIDLTGTPDNCLQLVTDICNEFGPKVLSYGKEDFNYIRKYSLSLKVKDPNATHFSKPYPLGPAQQQFIREKFRDLERLGLIYRARNCRFISSAFLVKKSAASAMEVVTKQAKPSWRIVVDFIELNRHQIFETDRFNVYSCQELLFRIGSLRGDSKGLIASSLDIKDFYGSLLVHPASRTYLGVRAYGISETFAFATAPLGVATLPSVFTDLLQQALSKETKQHCITHLDDCLLITGDDPAEHARLLRQLLSELAELGVLLSTKKAFLFKNKLTYLGTEIDGTGVRILPSRIDYVKKLPPPSNRKEMARFLGILSFCSSHLDSFAILASPLYNLLSIHRVFEMTEMHHKIVRILLFELEKAPSVHHIMQNVPLILSVDSSASGAGACLFQLAGHEAHLIRFWSVKYSASSSRAYHSTTFELVGVVRALEASLYLVQAHKELIILTDLKALAQCLGAAEGHNQGKLVRAASKLFSYHLSFRMAWLDSNDIRVVIPDWLSRIHYEGAERLGYVCRFSSKLESDNENYKDLTLPPAWAKNGMDISVQEFRAFITDMNKLRPEDKLKAAAKSAKKNAAGLAHNTKEVYAPRPPARKPMIVAHIAALGFASPAPAAVVTDPEGMYSTCDAEVKDCMQAVYTRALPCVEGNVETAALAALRFEITLPIVMGHVGATATADPKDSSILATATDHLPIADSGAADPAKHGMAITGDTAGTHLHVSPYYQITNALVKLDQVSAFPHLQKYFEQRQQQPPGCLAIKSIEKKYVYTDSGLVARWPLRLRGKQGERAKMLVSTVFALNILALIHSLFHGDETQLNVHFSKYYYTPNKSYLASVISKCCKVCALIVVPTKRDFLPGHVVRGTAPFQHLAVDFMTQQSAVYHRRKVNKILTIICTFSMLTLSVIVRDEKAATFIEGLEDVLTMIPTPVNILLSDNQTSLARHPLVREFCQKKGIRTTLTTPWHSQSNSPCELSNRIMRRCLQRLMLMHNEDNWTKVFHAAKLIQNTLIRTYARGTDKSFKMSAMQLVTGVDPESYLDAESASSTFDVATLIRTRAVVQQMLNKHYQRRQGDLAAKDADFKDEQQQLRQGALVLVRRQPENKLMPAFRPEIYRVLERRHRNVTITSVTTKKPQILRAAISTVKKLYYSDLIRLLSPEMQKLVGNYMPDGRPVSVIHSVDRYKPTARRTRAQQRKTSVRAADVSSSSSSGGSDKDSGSDDDTNYPKVIIEPLSTPISFAAKSAAPYAALAQRIPIKPPGGGDKRTFTATTLPQPDLRKGPSLLPILKKIPLPLPQPQKPLLLPVKATPLPFQLPLSTPSQLISFSPPRIPGTSPNVTQYSTADSPVNHLSWTSSPEGDAAAAGYFTPIATSSPKQSSVARLARSVIQSTRKRLNFRPAETAADVADNIVLSAAPKSQQNYAAKQFLPPTAASGAIPKGSVQQPQINVPAFSPAHVERTAPVNIAQPSLIKSPQPIPVRVTIPVLSPSPAPVPRELQQGWVAQQQQQQEGRQQQQQLSPKKQSPHAALPAAAAATPTRTPVIARVLTPAGKSPNVSVLTTPRRLATIAESPREVVPADFPGFRADKYDSPQTVAEKRRLRNERLAAEAAAAQVRSPVTTPVTARVLPLAGKSPLVTADVLTTSKRLVATAESPRGSPLAANPGARANKYASPQSIADAEERRRHGAHLAANPGVKAAKAATRDLAVFSPPPPKAIERPRRQQQPPAKLLDYYVDSDGRNTTSRAAIKADAAATKQTKPVATKQQKQKAPLVKKEKKGKTPERAFVPHPSVLAIPADKLSLATRNFQAKRAKKLAEQEAAAAAAASLKIAITQAIADSPQNSFSLHDSFNFESFRTSLPEDEVGRASIPVTASSRQNRRETYAKPY